MIHQATLVLTLRDGEWEAVITSTKSPAEVFYGLEPIISGLRDMANELEARSRPGTTPPLWGENVISTRFSAFRADELSELIIALDHRQAEVAEGNAYVWTDVVGTLLKEALLGVTDAPDVTGNPDSRSMEGCEKRGGVCDCNGRKCPWDRAAELGVI